MSRKIDAVAVQSVLYGLYSSIHTLVRGRGGAVIRNAAPAMLDALEGFGADFSNVTDIDELSTNLGKSLVDAGLCDGIEFNLEEVDGKQFIRTKVTNCAFWDLTVRLGKEGVPPFGCPYSALTVALAQRNLGKRARPVDLDGTPAPCAIPGAGPGNTQILIELFD